MIDIETIDITDTLRLRVVVDEDAENPRNEWGISGALTVNPQHNRIDVRPGHEFPGDLRRAYEELSGPHYARGFGDNVIRWARIFHGIELDLLDGTYWWVNPKDLEENFPASPTGNRKVMIARPGLPGRYWLTWEPSASVEQRVIRAEQRTYQQWADGEVVGVIVERAAPWEKTFVNSGDTVEGFDWVEADAMYGCYLDEEYTAQHVALDLDVEYTEEELAALRA
ncbi:MAG: hypothetical protein ABWY36_05435 [Leifsonia sp.]